MPQDWSQCDFAHASKQGSSPPVPVFKPIRSVDDLPPTGPTTRTAEAHSIDFKNTYPLNNQAEMAKDMAAFANALGGVILIGTSRDGDPLAYPGIARTYADQLSDRFADTHARHLSPKPPIIERIIFDAPASGTVLLAVNVHPFADQIVGARVDTNVWRFPIRVGADTNDLEPAMLPLYASAVRRNIILLENIDRARDKVRICFRNPRNTTNAQPSYLAAKIHSIDISKNVLVVTLENESDTYHRIPLDDIECVWDSAHNYADWVVRVLGHFGGDARREYHSNPSNTTMRT